MSSAPAATQPPIVLGIGADSGASAAWAVVALERGRLPQLILVHDVFGSDPHWSDRAWAGAQAVHRVAPDATWWIERPTNHVRSSAEVRHHNSSGGLGIRVGRLQEHAYRASGRWPVDVEPGHTAPERLAEERAKKRCSGRPQWWWYLRGIVVLRPKTDEQHGGGIERVDQAARAVRGAREALEAVPKTRRVDVAETILIAAACAIATIAVTPDARRP